MTLAELMSYEGTVAGGDRGSARESGRADSPLAPRHRAALQDIVDYVHRIDQRDLEIIDRDRVIVADAKHADVGIALKLAPDDPVEQTLRDGQPRTFVELNERHPSGLMQVVVPVRDADDAVAGVLVFEYTPLVGEMSALALGSLRKVGAAALAGWLVAALIALAIWRSVSRPLRDLQRAALEIAAGRTAAPVAVTSRDEAGQLAEAFNTMTQRLTQANAELNASNQHLQGELAVRRRVEQELEQLARFDVLTGLPNRKRFLDRLEEATRHADRAGHQIALMFLDLDRFKEINDTLGHGVGDEVLQQVAARLQATLRHNGTVSRLGGDEFTVLLEQVSGTDHVSEVARKILEAVRAPVIAGGCELVISASIGITLYPVDNHGSDELLRHADLALYQAKAAGRNTYHFHTEALSTAAAMRLKIERHLRYAIARNELTLHYQTRTDARHGRVTGVEALLRWHSPELGDIGPAEFIPVAEDSGLILPVGEWVLQQACRQQVAWQVDGLEPVVMAVNLSARQFWQNDLAETVERVIRQTGIDPAYLELELTEGMLMHDSAHVLAIMERLHGLGLRLSIDDFGTGYSSLSYLKRFPLHRLKIDRSFVKEVDSDANDTAIVAAILALAKGLNLQDTAEGVETPGQVSQLDGMGCDEYQGFYFSQPAAPDEVLAMLRASRAGQQAVEKARSAPG
ncbi:UNVERIFIED_ORG: diguanylate cyclase (GGDEF)-like protein [Burkholderia sp. 1595]|uniref:Diguanylate cyclase (GGDEF)-like protein n=1 Tax=Paraburkholderia terricola TaxID=169427 RepID=A0ABU1LZM1_9BURK|nr:EAL domain-containing protein [Paraburkholderia terricola]MDR6412203.1 diguanylate cyclase (GGDEF)-like protein [Paraburkholderia terricola]